MTGHITALPAATSLVGTELLEMSQLSTTVTKTASTISALASDNSYNDSGSGFVAAGFAVGDRVKVTGFTGNAANNILVGTITALTTGKMTIGGTDGDVIVDDAAGESVTIAKWVSHRSLLSAITAIANAYTDAAVTGLMDLKGSTDCSANPNYPSASKGDAYVVSVAGKIGGASGTSVDVGDVFFATADNAGGTEASVGASWAHIEHNLAGVALLAGATFTGAVHVPDDVYDATSWNASTEVATKNAIRDKIEAIVAGVPSAYTDEMARDAAAAMFADSATIDITYNDGADTLTVDVIQTALKPTENFIIACSDESTAITTGTAKATFRMPYAFTVTDVRASVNTAPTGSTILIDINEGGTTILSTKLMIDASEKTSTTAATPAVISDASLADDAEITIDFDQVGSTIAGKGVKVTIIGHRT